MHDTTAYVYKIQWTPEVRLLGVRPFASPNILNCYPTPNRPTAWLASQANSSLFSYDSAPPLFIQLDFKVVWCATLRNCNIFIFVYLAFHAFAIDIKCVIFTFSGGQNSFACKIKAMVRCPTMLWPLTSRTFGGILYTVSRADVSQVTGQGQEFPVHFSWHMPTPQSEWLY
jgi:hypothetical protein